MKEINDHEGNPRPPEAEILAAAEKMGIARNTLVFRVQKLGWLWERAMTTPKQEGGAGPNHPWRLEQIGEGKP
jgi:hypothetical protein